MPRIKLASTLKPLSPEKKAIRDMGQAVSDMIDALTRYADSYGVLFEAGIGEDYLIGDYWKQTCDGVIGLLDADTGNLDCADAHRKLLHLIERFFKTVGDDSLGLPIVDNAGETYTRFGQEQATRAKAIPDVPPVEKVPGSVSEIVYGAPKVIPDKPIGLTQLTDRQRHLVNQIKVDDDLARFTGDQIPDWPLLKKVMVALGGKWNSKRVGFVFPADLDAADIVRRAQQEGTILDPKAAEFFETPDALADLLASRAELRDGVEVLEPSAGQGALVRAILRVCRPSNIVCFEPFEDNWPMLEETLNQSTAYGFFIHHGVFALPAGTYDRVIMNPPFSNKKDIEHVMMAFQCLKPGGVLVAIMSGGTRFRSDKKTTQFRNFLESVNGEMWDNEPKAFHASGTDVSTVMVRIRKPML